MLKTVSFILQNFAHEYVGVAPNVTRHSCAGKEFYAALVRKKGRDGLYYWVLTRGESKEMALEKAIIALCFSDPMDELLYDVDGGLAWQLDEDQSSDAKRLFSFE